MLPLPWASPRLPCQDCGQLCASALLLFRTPFLAEILLQWFLLKKIEMSDPDRSDLFPHQQSRQ